MHYAKLNGVSAILCGMAAKIKRSMNYLKKMQWLRRNQGFYHVRWNRVGLNETRAAEVLGVSVEDVQEWDKKGAPEMAMRLLLLWDRKNVGVDGWDGFIFTRGVLKYKQHRWTPRMLILYHEQNTEIDRLQGEIRRLKNWAGLKKTFAEKINIGS